jgi:PhzF family phenazine biosynthesis protein
MTVTTPIPTYWIDAFSGAPFAGNPALVCVLDRPALDVTCQAIAREFNLSETVFVRAFNEAYEIRWFTPTKEVDLVGHATLAAACAIMTFVEPQRSEIVFHTRESGILRAWRDREVIAIDLPADTPRQVDLVLHRWSALLGSRRENSGPGGTTWPC